MRIPIIIYKVLLQAVERVKICYTPKGPKDPIIRYLGLG